MQKNKCGMNKNKLNFSRKTDAYEKKKKIKNYYSTNLSQSLIKTICQDNILKYDELKQI